MDMRVFDLLASRNKLAVTLQNDLSQIRDPVSIVTLCGGRVSHVSLTFYYHHSRYRPLLHSFQYFIVAYHAL